MKDLAAMCADIGFENVRTYIQSGNVVFKSRLGEKGIQAKLEKALEAKMGKKVDVVVRTAAELESVLKSNPFPDAIPAKVAVLFTSGAVPAGFAEKIVAPGGEEVQAAKREIYIYYPNGMGTSKLKLPRSETPFTARNINTVAKVLAIATA
jgi:uncharacterized protein (DUF1697 family)